MLGLRKNFAFADNILNEFFHILTIRGMKFNS
jgi:hypothetical protein